jgi:hypothetical protein
VVTVTREPAKHPDASVITILEAHEAIRKRPRMYFGVEQADPALPGAVLALVLCHMLGGNPFFRPARPAIVDVLVHGDTAFTVTRDGPGPDPRDRDEFTRLFTTMFTPWPYELHAAAAVSRRTSADSWCGGRHYRQAFSRVLPTGPVEDLGPTARSGLGASFELDADYFTADAAIPADPAFLLTGPCGEALMSSGGTLTIVDERHGCTLIRLT